jgi:hypothetical protein
MLKENNFYSKTKKQKYNEEYPVFLLTKYSRKREQESLRVMLLDNCFYKLSMKYSKFYNTHIFLEELTNLDITNLEYKLKKIPQKNYLPLEKMFISFKEKEKKEKKDKINKNKKDI